MDENKNPLKDSLDKSAIGLAVKLIREVWEKNRKLIYIDLIITAVIAIAVSGYVYEQSQLLTRAVRYFSWSGAIAGGAYKIFSIYADTILIAELPCLSADSSFS